MGFLEIFSRRFRKYLRSEPPAYFPVLDPSVQNILHIGTARIGHDTAVAQRPWTPFGSPLKPAENFPGGNFFRCFFCEHFFGKFANFHALSLQAAGSHGSSHLRRSIARAPVSILHHKGTRLFKNLVMYKICCTNRQTRVSRCGLDEDLFERRLVKYFSVSNTIKCDPAGMTHSLLAGASMKRTQH